MKLRTRAGARLVSVLLLAACGDDSGPRASKDAGQERHADAAQAEPARDAQTPQPSDASPLEPSDAAGAELRDAAAESGDADVPEAPRTLLAASGAQLLVDGQRLGLQLTAANLADDADVFAVHQEFYGIPWSAFEQGIAPPAEWSALMDELAAFAKQRARPVFLSVSMLNGARERLAATTRIENGQVKTDDMTSPTCYDFATAPDRTARREAYQRYVDAMLERFEPRFLNLAIEVNLFFEKCPAAAPGLVSFINQLYEQIKRKRPNLIVFPSFQIDHLYGYSKDSCADQSARDACFERLYAQLKDLKRDRFAMSSYPFLSEVGSVAAVPADWFERGAKRANERPIIVETGWPSTPLVARQSSACLTVFSFGESDTAAYVKRVLNDATRLHMELVTYWSDRDLVRSELMGDCPCKFDATWCSVLDLFRGQGSAEAMFYGEVLLKAFGSMGLRHYDGSPKAAALDAWSAFRSAPRP